VIQQTPKASTTKIDVQQGKSHPREMVIDVLPDNVFLKIFDLD
jgi:hypothetical protein